MSRPGWAGAGLLVLLLGVAVLGDRVAGHRYDAQDPDRALESPSAEHALGTDELGRDLGARLAVGARVSLLVAVGSTLIAMGIGVAYGAASGYVGGRLDDLLMRIVDVLYSLPDLLLIILVKAVLEGLLEQVSDLLRTTLALVLALSLTSWVSVARLTRGLVLQAREEAWMEAARALGARAPRLLLRHVLPNIAGPLLVTATFRIPAAVLAESTLSFIGLGFQPPFASWGVLAAGGFAAMRSYPHLILFPSLAIGLTLLAFHLVGDALRDRLDPRRAR